MQNHKQAAGVTGRVSHAKIVPERIQREGHKHFNIICVAPVLVPPKIVVGWFSVQVYFFSNCYPI